MRHAPEGVIESPRGHIHRVAAVLVEYGVGTMSHRTGCLGVDCQWAVENCPARAQQLSALFKMGRSHMRHHRLQMRRRRSRRGFLLRGLLLIKLSPEFRPPFRRNGRASRQAGCDESEHSGPTRQSFAVSRSAHHAIPRKFKFPIYVVGAATGCPTSAGCTTLPSFATSVPLIISSSQLMPKAFVFLSNIVSRKASRFLA